MCVLLDLPVYETEGTIVLIHVDVDVDERRRQMQILMASMCERTAVLWPGFAFWVAKRETRPRSATAG